MADMTSLKELRNATGAPVSKCLEALKNSGNDMQKAIDHLRKAGAAVASKKSGNEASEGCIGVLSETIDDTHRLAVCKISCQTDFVAKNSRFQDFCNLVMHTALKHNTFDPTAIMSIQTSENETVSSEKDRSVLVLGENISVSTLDVFTASPSEIIEYYLHSKYSTSMSRIASIVKLRSINSTKIEDQDKARRIAKTLAMHVVDARPTVIDEQSIPVEDIAKEREILLAQPNLKSKPSHVVDKIIEGQLNKYYAKIVFLKQEIVLSNDTRTVEQYIKDESDGTLKIESFAIYSID